MQGRDGVRFRPQERIEQFHRFRGLFDHDLDPQRIELPGEEERVCVEPLGRKQLRANGDDFGEFNGARNGFKAFWLRDDYRHNAMGISLKDLLGR